MWDDDMNIEETIQLFNDLSKKPKAEYTAYSHQYKQLAKWLEELKFIKDNATLNIVQVYQTAYYDAVKDLLNALDYVDKNRRI
jgi:hypothetical protein